MGLDSFDVAAASSSSSSPPAASNRPISISLPLFLSPSPDPSIAAVRPSFVDLKMRKNQFFRRSRPLENFPRLNPSHRRAAAAIFLFRFIMPWPANSYSTVFS